MNAVDVRLVADLDDAEAVVDLFAGVWADDRGNPPVRRELVWAVAHSGAYVAAAWEGGRAVGASLAWLGHEHGHTVLHSHMTAVDPSVRSAGIGLELKRHQRAWCIERGVDEVRWTYDPLVRRNAWFNLTRLGVTVVSYEIDFYGTLADRTNAGAGSDRVLVSWLVNGDRAVAAANDDLASPDADALLAGGAAVLLAEGDDGRPAPRDRHDGDGPALCATPADIERLRIEDAGAAHAWRTAVRAVLGSALHAGRQVTGITRDGRYVVERKATP